MPNISSDMRICNGLAMALAPFDTGNLKFNAIKSIRTNNGFRINYSMNQAFYVYFLEEGTQKSIKHRGFIGNKTVPTLASYLYAKYTMKYTKTVRRFQYVSRKNRVDFGETKERIALNEKSLALDVKKIASENQWEHNLENDVYDYDWFKRRV